MPIYKVNGKTYNIPDDKTEGFERQFPTATVAMENNGKKYELPINKRKGFMERFPTATYSVMNSGNVGEEQQTTLSSPSTTLNQVAVPVAEPQNTLTAEELGIEDDNKPAATEEKRTPELVRRQISDARTNFANLDTEGKAKALEEIFGVPMADIRSNYYNSIDRRYNPEEEYDDYDAIFNYATGGNSYDNEENENSNELTAFRNKRDMRLSEYGGYSENEIMAGLADEETTQRFLQAQERNAAKEQLTALERDVDAGINNIRADYYEDRDGFFDKIVDFLNPVDVEEFAISKDAQEIVAARNLLKEAREVMETVEDDKNFGEKAWDAIKNWSPINAFAGVADAARIYDLAEKFERGEELTHSEFMLMDALAINTAIHGLYANDITFDQKAGQVVGEMLPLAIEMLANPLSGTAKSATKSLAKYLSKRIANKTIRRTLTYAGGTAVSALAGYGMAATTGAPRTIAGTIDRMTGNAQVETDENGNVIVTGFENNSNFGEALVKEWSANAIDYATEIAGAEWAGKSLGWLGKKIPGGKWVDDMMTTLGNTKLGRAYKAFQDATHIKGSLEEFIEEWEAHELNRATIGDNEESFFSGDNAITTALAVSVVPSTIGGINAVTGMFTGAYKAGAAEKYKMMNAYNRAMELWGNEWQTVGMTLSNADPEFIEQELKSIYNSDEYTEEQKRVAIEFACHSLSYQAKRGVIDAMSDDRTRMLNDMLGGRFEEGYNTTDEQMHEVKKAWFVERERALETLGKDVVEKIDDDAVLALSLMDEAERAKAMDYVNALMRYDGMIQRVRDDIVGRIEQSDKLVDARTNRDSGMIQPATLKVDDRRVYVVSGNVVQYEDGSGIDNNASDGSIIIQDAESGEIEMISPDAILNIDEALDPINEKMVAAETIRMQFAQESADKIDNPIVIIGDETDSPIIPVDSEEELQEENRPQYNLNDTVSLTDENGSTVRGSITTDADADGRYEVYTEAPINGKRVNLFTRDELDSMLIEHNGVVFEQPADNEGNNGGENIPESGNNAPQNIGSADLTIPAMQRIPKDMQGNPLYEQTDSDTAWDAIVEQTEGDEAMAQTVADGMVADKEAALKKLEKAKSKGGATIAEKIAAEKERLAAIEAARQELAIWQKIAGTLSRRKMEAEAERRRVADEAAALRKAEEERLRAEREEAERIEREALNGVPDIVDDTPQDARARGYRRVSGHKIDRQEPVQGLQGKEVAVRFSDDAIANGRIAVIDATQLQPSHVQGVRNPLHFIDEAQPKERNDEASVLSARKIAGNIRPEEITSSVTAYTGAPTVNARGEAIQGNNRSDALRLMWESHEDQAAQYKQYLIDHADEFGLNADDVAAMERPVLVNMLDVDDAEAITLGQFVAQDTESGGTERIKPKNALQKIGNDMRSFANLLLKSNDEDTSFAGLVDNNGVEVLKWMSQRGYINPTQYKSAFDSKGNLTAEAKNDLRGIMYQSIFKGGSTRLEEMFNAMPAKAQKAILATAFRDYDSPNADRMIEEIQNSIRAFYALSQSEDFVNAKTFKDARLAVEGWKIQYQIDDVTGESYLPAENFSNFALLLATMYKGENQSVIQGTFNKLYDLIQGTQEPNLFEQPDNTPRSLAQAIYETLNITYDGQQRSNVLVGDSSASQRGQQGSTGDAATGERVENGERTADSAGSIEAESTTGGETLHQPQPERKGLEQTSDVGRKGDSTGVADDATQEVLGASNRGDIRVLEEGLDTSYSAYSDDSERTRRTAESERLVSLAKQHGLFIPAEVIKTLTGKVAKRTGESVVYIDTAAGKVTKVKDPYAKSAMKSGVQPEDAAFEHLVHNLLFPETAYTLEGISEEMGDVRIVLSQDFIQNYEQPTKEQIAEALAARGLFPEDNYSFGNELVSVTDVEGDNVLLGEDGTVYFIDPIIRFKKPLREILAALDGAEQNAPTIGEQIQAAEAEVNTNPTEAQKEAANDLANAEEAEELQREGEGMLTDRDVVMESDPYSKVLGRPRYYGKRQREYATRQRDRMARKAEQIADLLGIEIDVYDTADELNGKRAKAKGWFNPKTGKIAIVVSNHGSTGDIIETVLHEGVAHYGLRKLFGKHFDTFLDNVYNNVSYDIREKIVELAKGHNWDFRRATEEYLASLAENTNFEKVNPSLWSNIKSFFIKMLTKVGITLNEPLSDNELRYILWRSYQNLVNPGWFNVYGQAEDVSMQYSLSVGNYAEDAADTDIAADSNEDDLLMREGYSGFMINGELVPDKYVHAINHSANWRKKHKGAARCIVIQSGETLRTRLERAGFPQEKIDIAENMYNDGTLAAYFPVQDMVVIFNTDASESEIIGYLWHENAHRAIDRLYTQEEIETLFKNIVGKFEQDIREGLAEIGYEEDKQAEEFLVRMLEDLYLAHPEFAESGKFKFPEDENVNTKLLADVIKPLINFINNGNREEARRDAIRRLGDRGFRLIYDKTKGGETVEVRNSEAESVRGEAAPKAKRGEPEARIRAEARNRYERRVKSGMFQSREALQDSMLGLKEAMQAILGKGTNIEEVDGFENAYLGENRLSSVNKAEADAFAHTLFKPMLDEVAKLARNKAGREELTDYMMAKHGLERNEYMRNEAIKNGATDADQTDYAGLTALTGMDNVADAEAEAQRMVDEYENAHDTADLWEKVNAVSKAILQKSYECGMMSKETFDKVSNMYEFYIPLRGFDEKTSAEAYAYLTHKHSAFNAPIKKAEGRRSKADDPFANLQSMAEGAIMQGNRNKLVKQRFLNFALNHPSDLVSVSDIWVEYDAVTDEWRPVFPDNIDSTDTPEEVEQKMQDFETKMESLAQQHPDQYKRGKDAINIPYRIVESRDMRQHQVIVKRGGRDYVITINGNPRAAQALNGQTNPDNDMSGAIGAILRAGEKINRQLSAFYTTRNPDFIVSNFMRDLLYTNTMTWIKESPNYARRFHRNYLMVNPVKMKRLLARYRKGTLDMSNKTDAMFQQFMMNGGETGYANIRDIEKHKNDIKRELKKSNGRIIIQRAWDFLTELFDELNRAVENCARFAAFITSREMGRSIDRAIYDAKEISVNFNKKGSGAKFYDSTGQTRTGNASALVSGLGRSAYVFWNAAIQGTTNFGRQVKHHPAKALTGMATMFLLGAIVAYLGGDDDEDDKNAYYNLPEYVRRSNILFRAGDSWISIPLPIEYRAIYGMGELMTSVLSGKEHFTDGEIAEAVAAQMTQVLPLDFLEGDGGLNAFVPSAAKPLWEAYVAEKSWTGMPLYKDTPYNKNMPEWTKAYKSANKHIVNLAATLNEATGGDPYTKGTIDFNPAKVEYVLNGYFGGAFGTIDKLVKMGETWFGDREYDPRSFLLVNRLVKAGDERTEYRAVNNEYFRLKEEHDRLKTRLKHYEEDTDNGIFDYAEKIDFLYNSPEYERYEIFEEYRKDIDDLYDELKEAVNDEERKEIEAELNELKKEMIQEMNLTRGRK